MTPYDHVLAVRLAMTSEPIAVATARAVLVGLGHEKFAEEIQATPEGMPYFSGITDTPQHWAILRSFAAGHVAAGHHAVLESWPMALRCPDCEAHLRSSPSP